MLTSSNAQYIVQNNISGPILLFLPLENVTINLNGFTVGSGGGAESIGTECQTTRIENGTLNGIAVIDFGLGCLLKNISIFSDFTGLSYFQASDLTLDTVNITAPEAVLGQASGLLKFKNSRLISPLGYSGDTHAFFSDETVGDEIILEETSLINFTRDVNWGGLLSPKITLRNSKINITGSDPDILGTARLYTQHKAIINTTNESGHGVPLVVEVKDSNSAEGDPSFDLAANPTRSFFVATNTTGLAEIWLTEKLELMRVQSPLTVATVKYDPYNLKAVTKDNSTTVTLNITSNSTFHVPISLGFPTGGSLPQCTLTQMLDLDGDGDTDARDIKVVVDYMVGKPVNIVNTKGCNAINMLLP